jgi:dipeptide/tripeptide permease
VSALIGTIAVLLVIIGAVFIIDRLAKLFADSVTTKDRRNGWYSGFYILLMGAVLGSLALVDLLTSAGPELGWEVFGVVVAALAVIVGVTTLIRNSRSSPH